MKKFYREFICCVCGGKGIDKGSRQCAKYCSTKCRNKDYKRIIELENPCKHNKGVICDDQKCDGCGWNPEVQKARKEKIMEGEDYGR